MLIDSHTHFFPANIASNTIKFLSQKAQVESYGDGTIFALKRNMETENIDISINLPIATKASQVIGINRRMIKSNQENSNIICFGAMHPYFANIDDVYGELEFLKKNGIKGIKMHPEYQEFYPDTMEMVSIYEACNKLGLIIYFHAGQDIGFEHVHGTPASFAQVKIQYPDLRIVLAHMGGWRMWDDVEKYLMGLHEVYFDVAFCGDMEDWQMKEIIFAHSPLKIIFGSDYPWEKPSNVVSKIKNLGLGKMYEKAIFADNAKKLFDI